MSSKENKSIKLHIRDEDKCGKYSNVLAVSINSQEVVLDFAYRMPQASDDVHVVSRVNMSHTTARQIVTTLQNSLLDFENKKKK
jgi:DNA-directed RNA polymerase subunit L